MTNLIEMPIRLAPVRHEHECGTCGLEWICRDADCKVASDISICPACLYELGSVEVPLDREVGGLLAVAVVLGGLAAVWGLG